MLHQLSNALAVVVKAPGLSVWQRPYVQVGRRDVYANEYLWCTCG